MRNTILLGSLAFAVTLAILVGNRLSNEAMAVVTGALCGISATVPVTLALFIAMSRRWGHAPPDQEITPRQYAPPYHTQQPPVIVVAPPQMQTMPYGYSPSSFYLPPTINEGAPRGREFKIVGEE